MSKPLLLALLLLATPLAAQPAETRDVAYTTTNGVASRLDVYRPTAPGPAPVLVYFHGGAWSSGARPTSAASFREFLTMGFAVVSVDYRLADVAPAPAAVQDARCAVAWVKANAERYGFDVRRVVTYGTSAGGQLALLAAMLPTPWELDLAACRDVPRVAAVLDFYGPADVVDFAGRSARTRAWLGAGGDAMGRTMSPLRWVRAGVPPVLLVHGDADPTVPHAQSEALRDALTKAGVPNRLHTVPGGGHGKFDAAQKRDLMRAVAAFLAEQRIVGAR